MYYAFAGKRKKKHLMYSNQSQIKCLECYSDETFRSLNLAYRIEIDTVSIYQIEELPSHRRAYKYG
jgi:hypothetical protein